MMLGPSSAPSSPPETPVPTKCRPCAAQRLLAAAGVGEVRVAAVDDDVARLQQRRPARRSPRRWARRPCTMMMTARGRSSDATKSAIDSLGTNVPSSPCSRDQAAGARRRPVVHRHREAVAGQVAGQVAAHHRQPGHADLRPRLISHSCRHLSSHHYQRLETYRDVTRYGPVMGVPLLHVMWTLPMAARAVVNGRCARAGKLVVIPRRARQPSARRASIWATFPVSASVTPGRMSALSTTHPGHLAATTSTARLTTAITSSHSPSMVVNMASVWLGRPTHGPPGPPRRPVADRLTRPAGYRERDQHVADRASKNGCASVRRWLRYGHA